MKPLLVVAAVLSLLAISASSHGQAPRNGAPRPAIGPSIGPRLIAPQGELVQPPISARRSIAPAPARPYYSVGDQFHRQPLEELPSPTLLPAAPAGPSAVPVRYMTHYEFGYSFQPVPGNYEVVLLHPCTGCPVKVCFTLPHACLENVKVERHEIEFDYDDAPEVEIRFRRNGLVTVEYN